MMKNSGMERFSREAAFFDEGEVSFLAGETSRLTNPVPEPYCGYLIDFIL
jgi:hypothetical protein